MATWININSPLDLAILANLDYHVVLEYPVKQTSKEEWDYSILQ